MSVLLFDLRDSNLIDECDTKLEALEFVRKTMAEHGRAAVLNWSLEHSDRSEPPLHGNELIRQAMLTAA